MLEEHSLRIHDGGLVSRFLLHDLVGGLVGAVGVEWVPVKVEARDLALLRLALGGG
jgi:hypothetical protein